jgi:hypothetical protein
VNFQAFVIGGGEVLDSDSTWVYQDNILMYNTTLGAFQQTTMNLSPSRKSMAVFSVPRQVMP